MEPFNLNEFYYSVTRFWDSVSPIIFAHIFALIVVFLSTGGNWHVLERIEYFLNKDFYKRWRRVLDEFDLRSKAFFAIIIGLFLYFAFFNSVLGLLAGLTSVSIVYSETDFWEENRPLDDLIEIGSYGATATPDIWGIYSLKQKFLEEFRSRYPDRYSSEVEWLSQDFSKWLIYYRLSFGFLVFLIVFAISRIVNKTSRKSTRFPTLLGAIVASIAVILASRYQAEQYVERRLKAELFFVTTQLKIDSQIQKQRLDDETIKEIGYNLYDSLSDTDTRPPGLFWLSRVFEKFGISTRAFPHVSDSKFWSYYREFQPPTPASIPTTIP